MGNKFHKPTGMISFLFGKDWLVLQHLIFINSVVLYNHPTYVNSSSFVLRIIIELVLHIKIILKRTLQVFTHHWHNFTTAHEIIEVPQTSEFKTCCSYPKTILLFSNLNHELKPVIYRFQYDSMKYKLNKFDNLQI